MLVRELRGGFRVYTLHHPPPRFLFFLISELFIFVEKGRSRVMILLMHY